jgi:hypothetical protein
MLPLPADVSPQPCTAPQTLNIANSRDIVGSIATVLMAAEQRDLGSIPNGRACLLLIRTGYRAQSACLMCTGAQRSRRATNHFPAYNEEVELYFYFSIRLHGMVLKHTATLTSGHYTEGLYTVYAVFET